MVGNVVSSGVQVFSYDMMHKLSSHARVSKILDCVVRGEIVMIEGRLAATEETELISGALKNVSGKFSGVEIAFLDSKKTSGLSFFDKVKEALIKVLAKDRIGITVVGPSKLIKEIKMDPQKLEILFRK